MKTILPLLLLGAANLATAQSSTVRLIDAATEKARAVLAGGGKVEITVNNRSVMYTPRLIGRMLYVPIRFFEETGQRVTWDGTDLRGTIRAQNGPRKNSIEYDAKRGQKSFQPAPSMRPFYERGRLWVPLASGLAAFDLVTEWVPTSKRLNVRTNGPVR